MMKSTTLKMQNRNPCPALFMTPVIQWNGDVTVCCYDPMMELRVGNINEKPLEDIWYSEEMHKRRIMQIMGDFSYPSKCLACKNVDGIQITDKEIVEYLKNVGREDLISLYMFKQGKNHSTKDTIYVNPEKFSKQSWEKNFYYYLGKDGFEKGYHFLEGKGKGFFSFDINSNFALEKVKSIKVSANLATLNNLPNANSNISLIINGSEIGKNNISPLMGGKGSVYTWVITNKKLIDSLKEDFTITFSSEDIGLCILTRPSNSLNRYYPIKLEFSKKRMEVKFDAGANLTNNEWDKEFSKYSGKDGSSFIYGYDSGFFEYSFHSKLPKKSKIIISANLATFGWQDNKMVRRKGKVAVKFDGINLGERMVYPLEEGVGRTYSWVLEDTKGINCEGDHTIRFEPIASTGLAILEKQSEKKHLPITIRLVNDCELNGDIKQIAKSLINQPLEKPICNGFWKTPTVNWNGDVTVCCKDSDMQLKLGNLLEKGFNELWWDNIYANVTRLNHIKGDLSTIPLCSTCKFKEDMEQMPSTDIEEYLRYILGGGNLPKYQDSFLTIELTNKCNMKCIMCPQAEGNLWRSSRGEDEFGFMKLKDFKIIIDKLLAEKQSFRDIVLFWFGEPLLNPDFKEMVTYLESKRDKKLFDRILIHTNGSLLTKELSDFLIKLKGDFFFHFSIDAATKETYEKIRVGGDWNEVLANIQYFLQKKKGKKNISAVLQFIVMEENKNELGKFKEDWSNFFRENNMKFSVATMGNFDPKYYNFIFFRKLANQSFVSGKGFLKVPEGFYQEQLDKIN